MSFQLDVNPEVKNLLKDFLKELKTLNEHLADFKEMAAEYLGFKVIDKKEN